MDPARHKRLTALFDAARRLPQQDRRRWLEAICEDEPSLVREVLELLRHADKSTERAEGGSSINDAPTSVPVQKARLGDTEPRRIGRYSLRQRLGEGGMGVVYLAQRDGDNGGTGAFVALKLLRSTVVSDEEKQRFERERRLLNALDHPHVARLLDAGTTDDGHPYFVMEYVRGTQIDKYCDENRLTTEERLDLFRKVCDAVHYVHQNLIIHRDIKPGNILVTQDGEPKLLDFGISKLVNPALDPSIEVTSPGFRLLTPRYASPEQIRNLALTTATDVYSLGVLLYELLTGHWPYQVKTTEVREIEHAICDLEPERPSTAVNRTEGLGPDGRTRATDPTDIARLRGGVPSKIRSHLKGDLDNVLLKALDKAPRRRYQSAAELAEDLRRHLVNETVIARPPSVKYRVGKFIRRNRGLVAAMALVSIAVLIGFAATAWQYRNAEAARQVAVAAEREALEQRNRAEESARELWSLAVAMNERIHEAVLPLAGNLDARRLIVETAVTQLEALSQGRTLSPRQELQLAHAYSKLAATYSGKRAANSGDPDAARRLHAKAYATRERLAAAHPDDASAQVSLADSLVRLADLDADAGQFRDALAKYERAVPILESALNDERNGKNALQRLLSADEGLALCRENLGEIGAGSAVDAAMLERRRALATSHPTPVNRRILTVGLLDAGVRSLRAGDAQSALPRIDEAVAIRRELRASAEGTARAEHDLAAALIDRCRTLVAMDRPADALASAKEANQIMRQLVESEGESTDFRHRRTLAETHRMLGEAHAAGGDHAEALRECQTAAETFAALLATASQDTHARRRHVLSLVGAGEAALARHDAATAGESGAQAHASALILLGATNNAPADQILLARACLLRAHADAALAADPTRPEPARTRAKESAANWYRQTIDACKHAGDDATTEQIKSNARQGLEAVEQE